MGNHPNRSRAGRAGRNPTPAEIRQARESLGLTQTDAAEIIYGTLRGWQGWETAPGSPEHRRMHPGLWELFRMKTGLIEKP